MTCRAGVVYGRPMEQGSFRRGLVFAWLAVVMQLLAPMGVGFAMARVVAQDAPICHAEADDGGAPASGDHRGGLCPMCQVCCHGVHLLGAVPPPALPLPGTTYFVVRFERTPVQPRAPPRGRPYSRAPPSVATA